MGSVMGSVMNSLLRMSRASVFAGLAALVGLGGCHERKPSLQTSPSLKSAPAVKPAPQASQSSTLAKGGEVPHGAASSPSAKRAEPRPVSAASAASARSAGSAASAGAALIAEDFDRLALGKLPTGFAVAKGRWAIVDASRGGRSGRLLAQEAASSPMAFNLVLGTKRKLKDMHLSLDLRAVKGKEDQGGGPVWRAIDAKNYYVARYNPLEDNLRLYTVKKGHRKMLVGTTLRVDPKAWHTIEVTMKGKHIEVSLDGKRYLHFDDATFTAPGFVGIWTKADAQTFFDKLIVRP